MTWNNTSSPPPLRSAVFWIQTSFCLCCFFSSSFRLWLIVTLKDFLFCLPRRLRPLWHELVVGIKRLSWSVRITSSVQSDAVEFTAGLNKISTCLKHKQLYWYSWGFLRFSCSVSKVFQDISGQVLAVLYIGYAVVLTKVIADSFIWMKTWEWAILKCRWVASLKNRKLIWMMNGQFD